MISPVTVVDSFHVSVDRSTYPPGFRRGGLLTFLLLT